MNKFKFIAVFVLIMFLVVILKAIIIGVSLFLWLAKWGVIAACIAFLIAGFSSLTKDK